MLADGFQIKATDQLSVLPVHFRECADLYKVLGLRLTCINDRCLGVTNTAGSGGRSYQSEPAVLALGVNGDK